MRNILLGIIGILFLFFLISAETNPALDVKPEEYLKKADNAVKIDPDRSMDLAKSVLLFLKGSENEFLEIKARLIIGKALIFKGQFQEALKIFANIKARISLLRVEKIEEKLSNLCSEAFYYLGNIYMKLTRFNKAVDSYNKGLGFCTENGDSAIKTKILIGISRGYLLMSDLEKALSYVIQGTKSANTSSDIESIFFSVYLHGYIYRELKDYSKGLKKFEKAVKIAEKYNRPDLRIRAVNEISNIYILQKKYDQALKLKKEAIKIAEQKNMKSILSFCLNDIALIFIETKYYDKALHNLLRSRDLAKKDSNIRGVIVSDLNIADLYNKTGNLTKSFDTYKRVLKLAEKHNLKTTLMDALQSLSELLFKKKRFKEAYKYLERSFKLNSEIFSREKSSKIAELETEIEMEKSENRIILLEKINKIKQLELNKKNKFITLQKVTTFLLIIIATLIFLALRWKIKANKQLGKKSAELEKTLAEIHQLSGLLPICSSCKKIRDDDGYWHQVEEYINRHSEASFSHSMCPTCIEKFYPNKKKIRVSGKKKASGKKKK